MNQIKPLKGGGMIKKIIIFSTIICLTPLYVSGNIAYITGPGEPWGYVTPLTNDRALDLAFGAGKWDKVAFNAAIDFSKYSYIYVDGGDGQFDNFVNFLGNNRTKLDNYVSNGGSLWLNCGRWGNTNNIDLGFGASLVYGPSSTGNAVDPNHAIFKGPYLPVKTQNTGSSFAHDYILGGGAAIMKGDGGRDILTEKKYGSGFVMFGGLTTVEFHNNWGTGKVDPTALNLRANTFAYGAAQAHNVPEPSSCALILLGLFLTTGAAFNRKK
jgi:hypothetical protein